LFLVFSFSSPLNYCIYIPAKGVDIPGWRTSKLPFFLPGWFFLVIPFFSSFASLDFALYILSWLLFPFFTLLRFFRVIQSMCYGLFFSSGGAHLQEMDGFSLGPFSMFFFGASSCHDEDLCLLPVLFRGCLITSSASPFSNKGSIPFARPPSPFLIGFLPLPLCYHLEDHGVDWCFASLALPLLGNVRAVFQKLEQSSAPLVHFWLFLIPSPFPPVEEFFPLSYLSVSRRRALVDFPSGTVTPLPGSFFFFSPRMIGPEPLVTVGPPLFSSR